MGGPEVLGARLSPKWGRKLAGRTKKQAWGLNKDLVGMLVLPRLAAPKGVESALSHKNVI